MTCPHLRNNHSMSHRGTTPYIHRVGTQIVHLRTHPFLDSGEQKRPSHNATCVIMRPHCRIGKDFRFQKMGKLAIGIPAQRIWRLKVCPCEKSGGVAETNRIVYDVNGARIERIRTQPKFQEIFRILGHPREIFATRRPVL